MAYTVLWGAGTGVYVNSHIYMNHPAIGHCVAAKQEIVATVITDIPPHQNPIQTISDWILNSYIGQLNSDHYYQVSIPFLQQNPQTSREGRFSIRGDMYKFIQAAARIAIVEGASYSRVKMRSGSVCSVFGENLSDITQIAISTPLPTVLNNMSVYITYRSTSSYQQIPAEICPLFYVSPNQINIILKETLIETVFSEFCVWLFTKDGNVYSELTRTADYGGNFNQSPHSLCVYNRIYQSRRSCLLSSDSR